MEHLFLTVAKHCFCHHTVHGINITLSWASEGETGGPWSPLEFESFSIKRLFSWFPLGKTNFTTFDPPRKNLETSASGPPGKNPSDAHEHCHITGNSIQHMFEIGPPKISMGLHLRLKRRFGPP